MPTALKIYEGEQHGFRKSENIEDALNSELCFFSKVFLASTVSRPIQSVLHRGGPSGSRRWYRGSYARRY